MDKNKQRYHTNYKGELIDNTKDWEYKPLTNTTPVQMLNKLNEEFEKINKLFQSVGFKEYDYKILEKVMTETMNRTPQNTRPFLTEAKLSQNGQKIIYNNKEHTLEETVKDMNNIRLRLWKTSMENEKKTKTIEDMQTKINVLYTEIMMSKEHMKPEEWEEYKTRRKELEQKVGVKWIRR